LSLQIKLKPAFVLLLFISYLFVVACKSQDSSGTQYFEDSKLQLTEQEVLDTDFDYPITEEHIQHSIKRAQNKSFNLERGAKVILVQSGRQVPDSAMQEAMMKYYQVSVYSGISSNKNRPKTARKNDQNNSSEDVVKQKYMKVLRLIAANSKQDKIIVYWGNLELGYFNDDNKVTVWRSYAGGKIDASVKYLRYLIRFAIVDVKTGMWVMYSPTNKQNEFVKYGFNALENNILQINKIKEEAYRFAVYNLFNQFRKNNSLAPPPNYYLDNYFTSIK